MTNGIERWKLCFLSSQRLSYLP